MFISKREKEELQQKIESLTKRLDDFVGLQGANNDKVREQMRILYNDQKMKQEKVLAVEKLLEMTRGVLFSLKKEVSINRGDLLNLSKIAVVREEPAFALDGGEKPPEVKAVKTRRTRSTKGIKIGPLVTTPEAPWGLKKDGTPRKRPGRALKEVVA